MTESRDETDLILQVSIGDRPVDFTVSEAAKELGVSEEFIRQSCSPTEPRPRTVTTPQEPIVELSKDRAGRLYDFLHTQWAEARDAYLAADNIPEEEFYRGRREAMDAVLGELDTLMDES